MELVKPYNPGLSHRVAAFSELVAAVLKCSQSYIYKFNNGHYLLDSDQ